MPWLAPDLIKGAKPPFACKAGYPLTATRRINYIWVQSLSVWGSCLQRVIIPVTSLKEGLFAYPQQVPLQYVLSLFLICHSEDKARRISHNRSFAVLRMTQRTPCGGHTTASSQPARPLCRVFCGACGAAKHPHKSVSRVQIVYPLYYLLKKGFSAPGCHGWHLTS